ncbi:hypothetical protein MTO96_013384 [Rhipicephalus appendiculatus]
MNETTPHAAMDEEPSEDNEDGTWVLVAQKRKRQAQARATLSRATLSPRNTEQTSPRNTEQTSPRNTEPTH